MTDDGGKAPPAQQDSDTQIAEEAAKWVARMDGDDATRHAASFAQWRDASPLHAAAYRAHERLYQSRLLSAAGRSAGPEPLTRIWYAHPPTLAAIAASVVAVLAMTAFAFLRQSASTGQTIDLAATGAPLRQVALADGSILTLDHGARVRVMLDGASRRIYLLQGRARFDVAHDTARPFIVAAGGGHVRALGTLFDVALNPSGVKVALYRGAVAVGGRSGAMPTDRTARLKPGEGIDIDTHAQLSAIRRLETAPSWTTGPIAYDRVRLAAIIAQANSTGSPRISVAEAAMGDLRLSGTLSGGDNASLARQLAAAFDLTIRRSSSGGLLLIRK